MTQPDLHFDFFFQEAPFNELQAQVAHFQGSGALNRLFSLKVTIVLELGAIAELDPRQLVGSPAVLVITDEKRLQAAEAIKDQNLPFSFQAKWHGLISTVEIGERTRDQGLVEIQLTSLLAPLQDLTQNRVHLDASVIDIVEESLSLGGVRSQNFDFSQINRHNYPLREFVFQYDEDLLTFIQRNLEREGLALYHDQRGEMEVLRLVDQPQAFPAIIAEDGHELQLTRVAVTGQPLSPELTPVYNFRGKTRIPPARLLLKDYNWLKPNLPLEVSLPIAPNGRGEVYLFGENFDTEAEGTRLANIRKEEILAASSTFSGLTHSPGLLPGHVFSVNDEALAMMSGRYLVVAFETEGRRVGISPGLPALNPQNETPFFRHHFTCQKADQPFRPRRVTPARKISGSLTAWIDGAGSGEKPEMDLHGRYKVRLPLDISGRGAGQASAWIRQAQPSVGSSYGQAFPLHPGVEALLTFIDGNPDRPLISAAVPNGETGPNVNAALPEAAGLTTKGGGGLIFLNTPDCNTLSLTPGIRQAGLYFTAGLGEAEATEDPEPAGPAPQFSGAPLGSQREAEPAGPAPQFSGAPLGSQRETEPAGPAPQFSGAPLGSQRETEPAGPAPQFSVATNSSQSDVGHAPNEPTSPTPDEAQTGKEPDSQTSKLKSTVNALKNTSSSAVFNADTIESNAGFNKILSLYDGSVISGNKFEIKASVKAVSDYNQYFRMFSNTLAKVSNIVKSSKKITGEYSDDQYDSNNNPSTRLVKSLDIAMAYADDVLKGVKIFEKTKKTLDESRRVPGFTHTPMVELKVTKGGESSGVWQSRNVNEIPGFLKIFSAINSIATIGDSAASMGSSVDEVADEAKGKRDSWKINAKVPKAIGSLESALSSFLTTITMLKALDKKDKKGFVINNEQSYVNVKSREHLALSATGPILLESLTAGRQVDLAASPTYFDELDKDLLRPDTLDDSSSGQDEPYRNSQAILLRAIFQRTLATEINQQAHESLLNKAGRLIQLTTGEAEDEPYLSARREPYLVDHRLAAEIINTIVEGNLPDQSQVFDRHVAVQNPGLISHSEDFTQGILLETREKDQDIVLRANSDSSTVGVYQGVKRVLASAIKPLENRGLTLNDKGVSLTNLKDCGLILTEDEAQISVKKDYHLDIQDNNVQLLAGPGNEVAITNSALNIKHAKKIDAKADSRLTLKAGPTSTVDLMSDKVTIKGQVVSIG
jgi:type VI secretion system VgrG family protein